MKGQVKIIEAMNSTSCRRTYRSKSIYGTCGNG